MTTVYPGSFHWLQSSSHGVFGAKLLASGALAYLSYGKDVWGMGIYIWDGHNGLARRQITLPEDYAALMDNLAISPDGRTVAAITTSGLTIVHLASVPVGIGWLEPNAAQAAGGSTITVHGSGFDPGASLTIDGITVSATVVDASTITFSVPALKAGAKSVCVTNVAGDSYCLDAALTALP